MLKTKGLVITFAIAAIAVCGCIGVGMKHNYDQNVANEVSAIGTEETKFDKANYSTKLQNLKSIKSSLNAYKNGKEKDSKVIDKYNDAVKKETQFFVASYDKELDVPFTIPVSTSLVNNENKIKAQKKLIDDELVKIESESNITLTSDQLAKYRNKVIDLDKKYNSQIKSIDKKIAEIKAKAAADAKAKAEAVAEAKAKAEAAERAKEVAANSDSNSSGTSNGSGYSSANSSSNGYSNSGSNGGSTRSSGSNSGSSSKSNGNGLIPPGWYKWNASVDANGNIIPGTKVYLYSDGRRIYEDGSSFNVHDW